MKNQSELKNVDLESAETLASGSSNANSKTKKSSTSEAGHAKKVANLEVLISRCTAYGTSYNPTKNSIKLPQLNTLRSSANMALQNIKITKSAWDIASNNREMVFANLKKLATKVVNAVESTDATSQTIDDVLAINRKIQGKRANSPSEESETSTNQISVSQQSFDSLTDAFAKLVQRVSMEPLYVPNETELKVATLNTLLSTMKTANTNAINAETAYSNALIARDTIFYGNDVGLKAIATDVKKYVKSVFGSDSTQYKQISGLKFSSK